MTVEEIIQMIRDLLNDETGLEHEAYYKLINGLEDIINMYETC